LEHLFMTSSASTDETGECGGNPLFSRTKNKKKSQNNFRNAPYFLLFFSRTTIKK
jgi:hypothetical protein